MTEDTFRLAHLHATARESALHCPSSVRVSLLRLAAEDVGLLRQQSARGLLARLKEEDTMTSLRLGTVARLDVVSLPVESARLWLVV